MLGCYVWLIVVERCEAVLDVWFGFLLIVFCLGYLGMLGFMLNVVLALFLELRV